MIKILAIETSCDETAAAVVEQSGGQIKVLSNIIASQIPIHQSYGGVVPEIAAREHIKNIIPVIDSALHNAQLTRLTAPKKLNALAVVLTVSGGHTLLALMKSPLNYKIIGDTRDDAAGECFDKGARLLGLDYPGGPAIAAIATPRDNQSNIQYPISNIQLPRPMLNSKTLEFSFSGLKTALLYALRDDKNWHKKIPAYAAELQQAIIDVLIKKTLQAAKIYQAKTIMLTGGVSANTELRRQFTETFQNLYPTSDIRYPTSDFTTDNAAMIGAVALLKFKTKKNWPYHLVKVDSNLTL